MYLLHYAPDNASFIIRMTLEELGVPYRTALVDRRIGAQHSAAYRQINPAGLIPALETPEGPLFETGAILLWLAERHGRLAPAPGAPDRGAFLKWLFFTSNTLHAEERMLFYPEQYAGSGADSAAFLDGTQQRIRRHLALIEAMAATRPAFLSPDQPSVLGFYLCALLRWLALYPEGLPRWFRLADTPALALVAAATEALPAVRRAALAEGLGRTIFTMPAYATPPEGSAT